MDLFKNPVPSITVADLKNKIDGNEDFFLLDVRNPEEFETANIDGKLIPMTQITEKADSIPRDKEIVVHCHHGGRSAKVTEFLLNQGFEKVFNLEGGIDAWSLQIDPNVPRY